MTTQDNQKSNSIIVTKDLGKSVLTSEGMLHILSSIDLIINSGESIAIIGESGSGKSTLISLLAGLDTPSTGSININGKLRSFANIQLDVLISFKCSCHF